MVETRSYKPSMEIFLADRFQNNIELSTAIYNIQISKTALYGSIVEFSTARLNLNSPSRNRVLSFKFLAEMPIQKVSVRSFEVSLKDRYLSDS